MTSPIIVFLCLVLSEASYTILLTHDSPIFRVGRSYSVGLTFLNRGGLIGAVNAADQSSASLKRLSKSTRSARTMLEAV